MSTEQEILETFGLDITTDSTDAIIHRTRMIEDEVRMFGNSAARYRNDKKNLEYKINQNKKKIERGRVLPYLVASVREIVDPEDEANANSVTDGAAMDIDDKSKEKGVVIRTTTRKSLYLPVSGLVDADDLKPGELVGVNKDSYLILDKLPVEYDTRVKAMEVEDKPNADYTDVGGLDKQIKELHEAIVLPMEYPERFQNIGIQPPKGVLLYGEPGTGKTLLARACAAQTKSSFLKLAGPQLVQMYIGDGAKLIRDAFELAREKQPAIIFIDELDAIGARRYGGDSKTGSREVQRTMLELLNQMDGFDRCDRVKVIAATNRIDILDPALLRSGRLDRKIEFPLPDEAARVRILRIHSKKMRLSKNYPVNFEELSRSCEDFNAAQCRAVCVEAGMIALRRIEGRSKNKKTKRRKQSNTFEITHQDFVDGIAAVTAKKKGVISFFA
mmetsp:Transcript_7531/g.11178  ORF Transcript_7531/g.11178 Transcript_7531/m.11178 type:complete len:444 (+) Transcript_7531:69-1400(+)